MLSLPVMISNERQLRATYVMALPGGGLGLGPGRAEEGMKFSGNLVSRDCYGRAIEEAVLSKPQIQLGSRRIISEVELFHRTIWAKPDPP